MGESDDMKPVSRNNPEYRDTVKGWKAEIKAARKTGNRDDLVMAREELHTTRAARKDSGTSAFKRGY
jgi:hypothetical protein